MRSTPISFKGKEFIASDSIMAVWLHFVIQELDKLESMPLWLQNIHEEWSTQTYFDMGYVDPGLDQVITTEDERNQILLFCEAAMLKLQKYGEFVDADELNAMKTGGEGHVFSKRLPTKWFVRHGDYFIRLLKNELSPDETDARIDMFS